jgi:hypothetical protein
LDGELREEFPFRFEEDELEGVVVPLVSPFIM